MALVSLPEQVENANPLCVTVWPVRLGQLETHSWGFQEDADAEACVNWKLWDRCGPSQAINTNPVRNVPSCPKKSDDVHGESEDETIFSCVGNLVGKIA